MPASDLVVLGHLPELVGLAVGERGVSDRGLDEVCDWSLNGSVGNLFVRALDGGLDLEEVGPVQVVLLSDVPLKAGLGTGGLAAVHRTVDAGGEAPGAGGSSHLDCSLSFRSVRAGYMVGV